MNGLSGTLSLLMLSKTGQPDRDATGAVCRQHQRASQADDARTRRLPRPPAAAATTRPLAPNLNTCWPDVTATCH